MSKVDTNGRTVTIDKDGMIRVDGVAVFRRVIRGGDLYAQFMDGNRIRSQCRGTPYIEVSWDALTAKLIKETHL